MIGNTSIEVSASRPWMPLGPFAVFAGSAMTLRVSGVPRSGDGFELSGVLVSVTNAAGATASVSAVDTNGDGVWTATAPASHFAITGTVSGGVQVIATGSDETGAARSWIVGRGDLQILGADGVPTPGQTLQNVHLRDSVPETPAKGDLCEGANGWQIYTGDAWAAIAPSPSTSAPLMDGTASAGSSADYARGDHRHPTDTSRAQAGDVGALTVQYTQGPTWRWAVIGRYDSTVSSAWYIMIDDADHREVIPFAKGTTIDKRGYTYGYKFAISGEGDVTAEYYNDGDEVEHTDTVSADADLLARGYGVLVAENLAPSGVDSAPRAGSTNPVTSGGIKTALDDKLDKSGGTVTGELTIGLNPNYSAKFESDPDGAVTLLLRDSIGNVLYISGGKLYYRQYNWQTGVELYFPSIDGTLALAADIPYNLGTPIVIDKASSETVEGETVYYGAATLANRTANIVQVTATTALDELRITFPAATSGKVRDFGLRVEIGTGSAALTAPALVPIAPTGETIKLENADGTIPELADGTATAKGVTLLYFSETSSGVFVVKGEQVEEVA